MTKDHTPEYMKQLSGKILEIDFKDETLKMSFFAKEDICHSNGTIIQGGFTTDFVYTPMSIDINVAFLAAGRPGELECKSKIIKLGKSIGFASAELSQNNELIATASSSLKLVKIEGAQKDFIKDNIAKDAKIIKA